ncbi:hypothetical protein [Massilia sp. TSP1-1-2]|uniref:hypothetical protein n=1 Tax=unclassified Massilia TaxID=2609279 RepID=UPI003CE72C17
MNDKLKPNDAPVMGYRPEATGNPNLPDILFSGKRLREDTQKSVGRDDVAFAAFSGSGETGFASEKVRGEKQQPADSVGQYHQPARADHAGAKEAPGKDQAAAPDESKAAEAHDRPPVQAVGDKDAPVKNQAHPSPERAKPGDTGADQHPAKTDRADWKETHAGEKIFAGWIKEHRVEISHIVDSAKLSVTEKIFELSKLLLRDGIPKKIDEAEKLEKAKSGDGEKYEGPSVRMPREGEREAARQARQEAFEKWRAQEHPNAYDVMKGDAQRVGKALDPAGAGSVQAGVYGAARAAGASMETAMQLAELAEFAAQVAGVVGGMRAGAEAAPERTVDPTKEDVPLGPHKAEPPDFTREKGEHPDVMHGRGEMPLGRSYGEQAEPAARDRVAPGARITVPRTENVDYFSGGHRESASVQVELRDGKFVHVQRETWKGSELFQQQTQHGPHPDVAAAIKAKINKFSNSWYRQKWLDGRPESSGSGSAMKDKFGDVIHKMTFVEPAKYVVVVNIPDVQVTPEIQKAAQDALNKAVAANVSLQKFGGPSLPHIEAVVVGAAETKTPFLQPDPAYLFQHQQK